MSFSALCVVLLLLVCSYISFSQQQSEADDIVYTQCSKLELQIGINYATKNNFHLSKLTGDWFAVTMAGFGITNLTSFRNARVYQESIQSLDAGHQKHTLTANNNNRTSRNFVIDYASNEQLPRVSDCIHLRIDRINETTLKFRTKYVFDNPYLNEDVENLYQVRAGKKNNWEHHNTDERPSMLLGEDILLVEADLDKYMVLAFCSRDSIQMTEQTEHPLLTHVAIIVNANHLNTVSTQKRSAILLRLAERLGVKSFLGAELNTTCYKPTVDQSPIVKTKPCTVDNSIATNSASQALSINYVSMFFTIVTVYIGENLLWTIMLVLY